MVAVIQVKLNTTETLSIENIYNPCDVPERYAVDVKNIFAALDLIDIDREPEELWQEVEAIVKDEAEKNIAKLESQRRVIR